MVTATVPPASPARKAPGATAISPQLALQWAEALQVYPLYSAIARKFSLGEPCADLEAPAENPKAEQVLRARRWLDEMDHFIQVHQFRQFLQSAEYQNPREEGLRALIQRHVLRPKRSPNDGAKIDFLLTQYFALRAPEGISGQEIEPAAVAEVLEPVLGKMDVHPLDWFDQMEDLVHSLRSCASLRDLMESCILEQGRQIKTAAGDSFYDPSALVAFVRFNFLVRRAFIRLMHAELRAIRDRLEVLSHLGIQTVNCHAAGLSAEEPIVRLHHLCSAWKQPFAGNYTEISVGQAFGKLLAIRTAVEATSLLSRAQAATPLAPSPADTQPQPAEKKAAPPKGTTATPSSAHKAAPTRAAGQKDAPLAPVPAAAAAVAKPDVKVSPTGSAAPPSAAAPAKASASAAVAASPESPASAVDPEACMEKVWEQLIASPPTRGRSMTSVTYQNTKMLLSSWEVAAFVSEGGRISEDLRHGVVARMLVAVAMDALKHSGKFAALEATLELAHTRAAKLHECVEQAKKAKNTEGAVNLSITAKRLLAYIEEAEGGRG